MTISSIKGVVAMAELEIKRLRDIPGRLRDRHFAQAHTDVVGDENWREGYLAALVDCEKEMDNEMGVQNR